MSKKYFGEDRDFSRDYISFHNDIREENAPKTVSLKTLAVKGFLEFNGIRIPQIILKRTRGRKAIEAISKEKIPTREEVRRVLHHLPLHMKSFALMMISGGLRPSEVLELEFSDLEEDKDIMKINLRKTKSGRRRFTYITPEAKDVLNLWIESRDTYRLKGADLTKSKKLRKQYLERTENIIFPFIYNNANKIWHNAVKKAGLYQLDEETNRLTFRLHNLRKYFSTRGKWSDKDIQDFFQGHSRGVRAVYQRFEQTEDVLKEAYLNAIDSLTIEEHTNGSRIEKLKDRLAKRDFEDIKNIQNINYLLIQNRFLNEQLKEIQNKIDFLEKRVSQLFVEEGDLNLIKDLEPEEEEKPLSEDIVKMISIDEET
jgi:integrase